MKLCAFTSPLHHLVQFLKACESMTRSGYEALTTEHSGFSTFGRPNVPKLKALLYIVLFFVRRNKESGTCGTLHLEIGARKMSAVPRWRQGACSARWRTSCMRPWNCSAPLLACQICQLANSPAMASNSLHTCRIDPNWSELLHNLSRSVKLS